MASPSPADWALLYAAAGWRSFPVTPEKKSPMFRGWQADATVDPGLIAQYWNGPGGAERNLGLVCGEHFDAWDIEVEHVARFADWLTAHNYVLPECPMAQTGRGGIHLLTAPTGVDGTRYLYLDGVHVGELKSRGGFILACPSETDDLYRWTHLPARLEVPAAPEWLLGLLERPEGPKKVRIAPYVSLTPRPVSLAPESDIKPLVEAVRRSVQNDRNANLHWAANRACDDGVPQALATRELLVPFMEIALADESHADRIREGRATIASAYNR